MTDATNSAAASAAGDVHDTFQNFGLPDGLLQTLTAADLVTPTPIQSMAIPYALQGRDLIGLAQTGTGKTAAFLLPILAKLPTEDKPRQGRLPKALILSPTRELATQIATNFVKLSTHTNLRQVTVCGGMRYDNQIRALRKGIDVVIATPGRLEDLMERGAFDPDEIDYFVMDEADHMLDLGFYPPMKRIFAALPETCQTMLFSATMPPEIATLAKEFLNDPHHVTAPQTGMTVDRIKQQVTFLSDAGKRARLEQILTEEHQEQALIFVRTKRRADMLADKLADSGMDVDVLHGDLRQSIRQKVLRKFRDGHIQAVIATDVAARGIDVSGLNLVINFDLTDTPEAYIHRVGRTGRAGQSGVALSFCAPDEKRKLAAIIEKVGDVIELFEADGTLVEDFSIGRRGAGGRSRPPAHVRKRGGGRERPVRREARPEFSRFDPLDDSGADRGKPRSKGKGEGRGPKKFGDRKTRADGKFGRGDRAKSFEDRPKRPFKQFDDRPAADFDERPAKRPRRQDDADFGGSKRGKAGFGKSKKWGEDRQSRSERPQRREKESRNRFDDTYSDRDSGFKSDRDARPSRGGKPFNKRSDNNRPDNNRSSNNRSGGKRRDESGFDYQDRAQNRGSKDSSYKRASDDWSDSKPKKKSSAKRSFDKPARGASETRPANKKPRQDSGTSNRPNSRPTSRPGKNRSARISPGKQGGFGGMKRRNG